MVGFGDIAPATTLGKLIAAVNMLMEYDIIAVPKGIVRHEMARAPSNTSTCSSCDLK